MNHYSIVIFPVFCLVMLFTSCQSANKMDSRVTNVTGEWSGTWWYGNSVSEGQPLLCTCTQIGSNQWTAIFDAQYGERSLYTFDITGEQVGDAVLFAGAVDLGADHGGVYQWKGEARGNTFIGEYTSEKAIGAFKMTRS